jgi:hypothetical protein
MDEWSAHHRGLYLHRTTLETNIHAPSGIQTHDPSNQAATDRTVTGIGKQTIGLYKYT